MNSKAIRGFLEKYILIIAMFAGIILRRQMQLLAPVIPYFIFTMLFITYSSISWKEIKLTKFHYSLLLFQYLISIVLYLLLLPINQTLAQSVMICVLAPTATSAPVITRILGGEISVVATYSLVSNLSLALIGPFILSAIGHSGDTLSFGFAIGSIFKKILPVLILPFVLVTILRNTLPVLHRKIQSVQILSFYLWAISLVVVIGQVANFVELHPSKSIVLFGGIIVGSLIICILQFLIGRKIGRRCNHSIAGGQGLGQKNTILAIWLAQTYLNPLTTLGPGTYVLWQNIVNAYQIWKKKHMERKSEVRGPDL